MQQRVMAAWREYAPRHRGRCLFVSLEDFTRQPEPCLRSILQAGREVLPAAVEMAASAPRG